MAVVFLSPMNPLVLIGVPLAVFLLAFPGPSFATAALAGLLLATALFGISTAGSPLWFAERAWAFLLAGGFVFATLLIPKAKLLVRSITGLAVACAGVGIFAFFRPETVAEVDWLVETQLARMATIAYELVASGRLEGLGATLRQAVQIQKLLYPSLLSLASIAALAVAWQVMARLRGRQEGLTPLREFRFSDQFVWILIVGLLLFILPAGEIAARLGENAMVFMGGLYLLRGFAILVWLAAAVVTSSWAAVAWFLLAVVFYPIMVGLAMLIGISDTWLDLRRRLRRSSSSGR